MTVDWEFSRDLKTLESFKEPEFGADKICLLETAFLFLDFVPREGNLSFKPISNILSVHQVIVDNLSANIIIRELSCFWQKCDS